MRISTKGRYAIKLMLDLATNDNGEPIRLKGCSAQTGDFREISGADHFCIK